jgi:hypothetical protein
MAKADVIARARPIYLEAILARVVRIAWSGYKKDPIEVASQEKANESGTRHTCLQS